MKSAINFPIINVLIVNILLILANMNLLLKVFSIFLLKFFFVETFSVTLFFFKTFCHMCERMQFYNSWTLIY